MAYTSPQGNAIDFNFTESGYTPSLDFQFAPIPEPPISYYILKGTSNNFTSIWIYNEKMYVSSSDALTAININDNSVYDFYTQTENGRGNETLSSDNVIDINVTQGV